MSQAISGVGSMSSSDTALGCGGQTLSKQEPPCGVILQRRCLPWLQAKKLLLLQLMLVGDTDTGKSTLAIYLANMAITNGLVPSVIDGDIGQGDLAPPTAIGAVVLSKQVVDLRDVNTTTNQFEFVGGISPIGFEGLIAKKLRSLLDRTSSLANICIVNTDGYVRNGGVQNKAMIAEEIQPDVVICLGENVELV